MKILHAIRSVDPASGGPAEFIRQYASVLTKCGHTIEVASLDGPDAPYLATTTLPLHPLGPALGKYGYSPRFVPWLCENAGKFDAVVVNGLWQYNSFGVWRALRKSGRRYVAFTHGMLDPWFKRQYPLKHAKKWLYWPWADYRVLRDAAAVLFTCEEERLLARESFWLYQCNEIVVSYGASAPTGDVTAQKAAFFDRYPDAKGKRLALFMGRIHPKKGCDLLIEAFAAVLRKDPDWRLVIAGPDQVGWQAELLRLANRSRVAERIIWAGMISGDMKWGALEAAEVFVLPSHQENFGIVVAEALARGVPALISKQVNIWREVERDGAGLVAADDFDGTCSLLRSWTSLPDADRQAMKLRASQCFQNRFEIKKAAESVLKAITVSLN